MAIQRIGNFLNAAVVGAGGIGALHARGYQHCKNVRIAAVVDVNRELADTLAARYYLPAFYDIKDVLKDPNIDIIDVVVPTKFHSAVAIQAAEAGKHCIVEKPIALDPEEFGKMAAAFKKSGTVFGGIFQHRFTDAAIEAKRKIDAGELGDLLLGSSSTVWWRGDAYWNDPNRCTYEAAGGGVLMVHAIHAEDLLIHLMGEPDTVSAKLTHGGSLPGHVKVEHSGAGLIRFTNHAIATVMGTVLSKSDIYEGESDHMKAIDKEKHTVTVMGSNGSIRIITPDGDSEHLFARNLDDMAYVAFTGGIPLVSGASAWRTVSTIKALYRSASEGGATVSV